MALSLRKPVFWVLMTSVENPGLSIRLDKWLWHARFFKSRSLAAAAVKGPLKLNGNPVAKPSQAVRAGDVVTFTQGDRVRVIRVVEPGARRGPATEAQTLYDDLQPTPPEKDAGTPEIRKGGRPTGKARRDFDAERSRFDDSGFE